MRLEWAHGKQTIEMPLLKLLLLVFALWAVLGWVWATHVPLLGPFLPVLGLLP